MVAPVDKPNSVSLFLQVPMYIIITVAEVMFSINGLEFAYSQAPASMKAICQAAWLWTVAFGNLVVVIIAESKLFESQVHVQICTLHVHLFNNAVKYRHMIY